MCLLKNFFPLDLIFVANSVFFLLIFVSPLKISYNVFNFKSQIILKENKSMEFNKLVRDNIPDIITKNGRLPVTHIAEPEEFEMALAKKLVEESTEFLENQTQEELIDVIEVIETICYVKGYDKEELEKLRKEKLKRRGGYVNRTILEKTE